MSDIEEIKKAQIFLLEAHIDDVVLNAKEYPENTKENAKEWIYLSSVLKAYSNQQKYTIDKLTKEVEQLHKDKSFYSEQWEKTSKEVEEANKHIEDLNQLATDRGNEVHNLKEQLKESEDKMQEVGNALKMDYS